MRTVAITTDIELESIVRGDWIWDHRANILNSLMRSMLAEAFASFGQVRDVHQLDHWLENYEWYLRRQLAEVMNCFW